MTQKSIKKFINEVHSKPPKKKYITNQTDVCHIDDIWILDILDLKVYGPEINRNYWCILVFTDKISWFACTLAIRNKNAITIKDSFERIIESSKENQIVSNLIEEKNYMTIFFKIF